MFSTTETSQSEPESLDSSNPWTLLIVDDETDVHTLTKLILKNLSFENRPIACISAYSGVEAKAILQKRDDIALIILDVVMESDDAGLKLVKYIRNELNNSIVQILLRTGQPGRTPEQDVILKYGINDYKSKSELTNTRLYTSVIDSLRAYTQSYDIHKLNKRLEAELEIR